MNLRLTSEEWNRLESMADRRGVSPQDFIRSLIRMNGRWTEFERLVLLNLLEIRRQIEGSKPNARYAELIEIVGDGYEVFYPSVAASFGLHEPMPIEQGKFVLNVLSLYRAIENFKRENPAETRSFAKNSYATFQGFDGNDEYECACMSFARFLIEDQNKFVEQRAYEEATDSFNSHRPMRQIYEAMLARWAALDHKFDLTRADIEKLLVAARDSAINRVAEGHNHQSSSIDATTPARGGARSRALREDVLWILNMEKAMKPTDLIVELAAHYPYVATVINRVLDELHSEMLVRGSPAQGYTLTPKGAAARGFSEQEG